MYLRERSSFERRRQKSRLVVKKCRFNKWVPEDALPNNFNFSPRDGEIAVYDINNRFVYDINNRYHVCAFRNY